LEFVAQKVSDLPKIAKDILAATSKKVFLFNGEMGAGKTTLIKQFCTLLECEDETSSPTFSLVNHYVSVKHGDIFHFDFYRINSVEEAFDIGFEEYLASDSICLIEWPEKIMKLISEPYVNIEIVSNPQSRFINVHL
jgi:tRNA threonylcarbamoyladenosine biosynthesis protein TsaE